MFKFIIDSFFARARFNQGGGEVGQPGTTETARLSFLCKTFNLLPQTPPHPLLWLPGWRYQVACRWGREFVLVV